MVVLLFLSTFSVAFTVFAASEEDILNSLLSEMESGALTPVLEEGTTEEITEAITESTTVKEETTEKITEEKETEQDETIDEGKESSLIVPEDTTVVTLDIEEDLGNLVAVFTNVSSEKEYEVVLYYDTRGCYIGTTMMPIGKYNIQIQEKEDVEVSLNEKSIEFRNYEETINLTHNKIKENGVSEFGQLIKDNLILIVLLLGSAIVYVVIKYKNDVINKD